MLHYDLIVIGSGPGGEGAALKAAKEGKKVAIIDSSEIGGNCIHKGTIPSKALRHTVQKFASHKKYHEYSYPQMLENASEVIAQQVVLRTGFYKRNNVDIYQGHARFIDEHTVSISHFVNGREDISATAFVLATGSRPYRPNDIDFDNPRILDSDSILELKNNLKSIVVYGAGVIGCEYASIFRTLKVRVTLINTRAQLLSFLDSEIIDALAYHLRDEGVRIFHNEKYSSVEANSDEVIVNLESNKVIKADYLLFAQGRTGNSDDLNLEAIGISYDHRGLIDVNENYQTHSHSHIYAVGDLVGYPSLASAAFDQGRFAATHLVYGKCDQKLIEDIPTGIYTLPEISSIGKTEKELTSEKVPYEVGYAYFKDLARAQISGKLTGELKLIFHRETLQVLGIHCFGNQASEIVHIGQAIMSQEGKANTIMYFINTTFNYPTMAEGYRVAALNGLNRL